MCGLYSRRSSFISYTIRLSVCSDIFLCIALALTPTLGGVDIKGKLHHISTKPPTSPMFTLYARVYYNN